LQKNIYGEVSYKYFEDYYIDKVHIYNIHYSIIVNLIKNSTFVLKCHLCSY